MHGFSRRDFLNRLSSTLGLSAALTVLPPLGLTVLSGCRSEFEREAHQYDLGEVKDLLYGMQLLRQHALLVLRDQRGWAAMSARCTYDGCDLSYQQRSLLCMCCYSEFSHNGQVLTGKARKALPYFKITYSDGRLFADTGAAVDPSVRFTTPEIELAIAGVRQRLEREIARPGARIPEVLLGQQNPDDRLDGMFRERTDRSVSGLTEDSRVEDEVSDASATPQPSSSPALVLPPLFSD